ncbi:MAG TPA: hypothetical protein RMH99_20205 [Sandaracinaceae bacterium LLY-WYZ-13_1]|nr:hypothetical protein [Sandaracinaceae bacterium LLY-WYZ-13_1]
MNETLESVVPRDGESWVDVMNRQHSDAPICRLVPLLEATAPAQVAPYRDQLVQLHARLTELREGAFAADPGLRQDEVGGWTGDVLALVTARIETPDSSPEQVRVLEQLVEAVRSRAPNHEAAGIDYEALEQAKGWLFSGSDGSGQVTTPAVAAVMRRLRRESEGVDVDGNFLLEGVPELVFEYYLEAREAGLLDQVVADPAERDEVNALVDARLG